MGTYFWVITEKCGSGIISERMHLYDINQMGCELSHCHTLNMSLINSNNNRLVSVIVDVIDITRIIIARLYRCPRPSDNFNWFNKIWINTVISVFQNILICNKLIEKGNKNWINKQKAQRLRETEKSTACLAHFEKSRIIVFFDDNSSHRSSENVKSFVTLHFIMILN